MNDTQAPVSQRVLLLVDDEENILKSLMRLLRRDGYTILRAQSGEEALRILAEHTVQVVLSDQRMPNMIGSELLGRVKALYPDTVRLMLSGYTDLESVTDAINRGAIYRFLTKPWDDELLRQNVAEAFRQYELVHENQRLNERLQEANAALARQVAEQSSLASFSNRALHVTHEIMDCLPLAVLGIDRDGLLVFFNRAALPWLQPGQGIDSLGAEETLPVSLQPLLARLHNDDLAAWPCRVSLPTGCGEPIDCIINRVGNSDPSWGWVIVIVHGTPP